MTDKERIKCKYKFQDKEKFDGKTYCTCFCELCEDLPPCDDNCQIYEDFKQLTRKTQIINEIEEAIKPYQEPIELDALSLPGAIESILERKTKEYKELKTKYDALYIDFVALVARLTKYSLGRECEELKEKLRELELKNTTLQNRNQQLDGVITECDRYRKALEEIEKELKEDIYCESQECGCDDFEECLRCTKNKILDIINKAKEKGMNNELNKNLYEFINIGDKITFYAKDDDIARAVTLLLGEGKAGCKKQDGEQLENCFTAFGNSVPDEVYKQIEDFVKNGNQDLINALNTIACCDFDEREIYDDYTENSTNQEKWEKWDNKHRTSLNNFGKYARKLANIISTKRR